MLHPSISQDITPRRPVRILVAARPGPMRNALLSFLMAIPNVQIAGLADGADTVKEKLSHCAVDALIVDADLGEALLLELLRECQTQPTILRCVFLVENRRQQAAFQAAGASHTLLKGFLDDRLRQIIETMPDRSIGP